MWITNGSKRVLIDDGTFPYWRSLGWQNDANEDLIGDETAAEQAAVTAEQAAEAAEAAALAAAEAVAEDLAAVVTNYDGQLAALTPNNMAPLAVNSAAAAGISGRAARVDHVHTGRKLAAIAAPTAPGVVYSQAEAASAVAAINAIRAALTAHGITL